MTTTFVLVALLATPAQTQDKAAAKVVEEKAFAAVEAKSWCPAMQLFLDANDLDPTPDYVFNAAQAAEAAGDVAKAVELYTKLLASAAKSARKADAKKRLALLATKSSTVTCAPPPPPPTTPVETKLEPTPTTTTTTTPTTTTTAPTTTPTPTTTTTTAAVWPYFVAGGGGVAVVVGAGVAVVGALPFFDHEGARASLAAADKARSTDGVAALYAKQETARADWDSWGALTTTTGLILVGAGVAAVGAGVALTFTGGT